MVFSSVAPFLDHHSWNQQLQQSNHQLIGNDGGGENPNFQSPLVPPQRGGEGSVRPGSMVDRARLAKLPMPEPGLNCPRCDSTNTKFCYFNNYSLTQPRHFCKTCRRYWTRGGALRNVPVGGGCRRNKRSNKNNRRSRSPSQKGTKSISGSPSRCSNENIASSSQLSHPPSLHMPFMGSYGGVASNIISSVGGFHPQSDQMGGFQLGSGGSINGNNNNNTNNNNNFSNILSIGSGESWRLPFLAGFEVPNNTNLLLYQSQGAVEAPVNPPPVKVEENRDLNLSRQVILGMSENTNQQPWQMGNNWTEFSGVNASSTPTTHFI